jgi:hypothetical protein
MLGIMFLFGAGEEVSWGQRQVDAEGPRRLVEANAQGEWTAHNLAAIDGSVDVLFTLFILGFAIVLPLAAHRSPALMARARGLVPVFPAWIALLFIANEVAFRAVWWGMPEDWYDGIHPFTQSAHEIRESVASLLFALAALVVLRRGPSQGADPGAVSRSGRPGTSARRAPPRARHPPRAGMRAVCSGPSPSRCAMAIHPAVVVGAAGRRPLLQRRYMGAPPPPAAAGARGTGRCSRGLARAVNANRTDARHARGQKR